MFTLTTKFELEMYTIIVTLKQIDRWDKWVPKKLHKLGIEPVVA